VSNSSVFRAHRKLLKESDILQLYDSEFQTDGAPLLKAFADNASVIRGTDSNSLSADRRVRDGWYSLIGLGFVLTVFAVSMCK